ncbi:hypothetical protein C8R43DRAFT_1132481 [Mycena crocata]|nr:hypothetical protein C8R43DRAFT_1132481 [Mycena crocata]
MSLHLGSRCHCAVTGCECNVFLTENSDGSPRYTTFLVPLAVIPGWRMEEIPPMLQLTINHGSRVGLGPTITFVPTSIRLSTRGICGANAYVIALGPLTVVLALAVSVSHEPSAPPVPAPVPPSSLLVSPQRPVLAYSGIVRPSPATVQAVQNSRQASIYNSLPQYQSGSSSTSGRKRARLSGNPRPFATTAATLNDFASPSGSDVPTTVPVTIGILPKVFSTSAHNNSLDLSPPYFWKEGADLEAAQLQLKSANLVFTVDVPASGPIFESIDEGFLNHCAKHRILFVAPPPKYTNGEIIRTPNALAWVLSGPKGRAGNRTWVQDPKCLTAFTFAVSALRASPFSNTPNYLGEGIFTFIVPALQNLIAPIDCLFEPATRLPIHVLQHRCFARRVLRPILASLSDDPHPTCSPRCTERTPPTIDLTHLDSVDIPMEEDTEPTHPSGSIFSDDESDDDVHFPEAEALIDEIVAEGLPPMTMPQEPSQILTRAAHRRRWEAEAPAPPPSSPAPFVAGPLLSSIMDSASTLFKSRSFAPGIDLTLRASPGAGSHSLVAWQDHMAEIHGPTDDVIRVGASTVDIGARTLIAFCIWLHSAGSPPAVKFKEVLEEQFPAPRPTVVGPFTEVALFSLNIKIGPGLGRGPRHEVLARAVQILTADPLYWTDCGDYKALRLHPSFSPIPRRSAFLKATGLILLLHYLHIGAPYPVSPFIFSTLFDGRRTATRFDFEFLARFISRDSLAQIKSFHSIPLDAPLYQAATADCVEYQYLINIPGIDPSLISRSRSRAEHDGVCGSIISFITLGCLDIEHHPDFLSVGDGFNVVLDPFDTYTQVHHVLEWFETPCKRLITASYNLHIKTVADIVSHIVFSQANPESDPWMENSETVELIKTFLFHYLTEPGHPYIPGGIVEALLEINDAREHNGDALLRARLFMGVMTGSQSLPVDSFWSLKVTIIHDWDETYPYTDPHGVEWLGPEAKASFQSCFRTVSITNNARLRKMLLSEKRLVEGKDTEFGRWFHGQALSSRESYNSA